MLEKKRRLANSLWEKGITVIYAENETNRVFVAMETEDVNEVAHLIKEEGFELTATPAKGLYATSKWYKEGYWCNLK